MGRNEWLAGQARTFTALQGKRVDKWVGVEMALREDLAGTGPQFGKSYDDGRWDGIYRWRSFPELPTGSVDHVALFLDQHLLAEVHFRIGARPLALVAGELEERHDGGLTFQRLDESVLAFTDSVAVERVPWNTARQIRRFLKA